MTFEERMAELGVDLSDLPRHYEEIPVWKITSAASDWCDDERGEPIYAIYEYILHLTDIIDRMETALENVIGERDYLLKIYGYDCKECKNHDECNGCDYDSVENWAGVPEDWSVDNG